MKNVVVMVAIVSLLIIGFAGPWLYAENEALAWTLALVYVAGWGVYALWQRRQSFPPRPRTDEPSQVDG